jgi:hypothetical protein
MTVPLRPSIGSLVLANIRIDVNTTGDVITLILKVYCLELFFCFSSYHDYKKQQ